MTKRRTLWTLLAGALGAAGVLAYVVMQRDADAGAAPIPTPPPVAVVERPSLGDAELAGSRAPQLESATPVAVPVSSPPADAPAESFASVTGRVRFADGTIPPPFQLVIEMPAPDGARTVRDDAEGACRRKRSARTDADGRFAIDGLCTGPYRVRMADFGSAAQFDGLVHAPARDVQLVVPGWLLLVDVVGTDDVPVAGARVRANYLPDRAPARAPQTARQLVRSTPASGRVEFLLLEPSQVTLDAFVGTLVSDEVVVELRTASSAAAKLVLAPSRSRPELRIAITSCGPAREPVALYCLNFDDAATGLRMFRVCSEDVGLDGTIDTVRPGTYRVRVDARYLGEPVHYRVPPKDESVKLVVEEGRVNELAVCVHLGGRIALEVRERSPVDGAATPVAIVSRVDERDGSARFFDLREPDDTGVTVSHVLPFGVERQSEDVLDEGEYVLRVTAKGFVDQDVRVFVRTGETAKAVVLLDRAR